MEKPNTAQKDHLEKTENMKFAGVHLLVELWKARFLTDIDSIERILKEAVHACGATILNVDLHVFSPNGGVSGVALLKESHMSIHTWPEYEYAAVDVFVCGTINPRLVLPVLKEEFQPDRMDVQEIKRGIFHNPQNER